MTRHTQRPPPRPHTPKIGVAILFLLLSALALWFCRPPRPNLSSRELGSLVIEIDSSGGEHIWSPYSSEARPSGMRPRGNIDMSLSVLPSPSGNALVKRYAVPYALGVVRYTYDSTKTSVGANYSDAQALEHHAAVEHDTLLRLIAADIGGKLRSPSPSGQISTVPNIPPPSYFTGTVILWNRLAHDVACLIWSTVLIAVGVFVASAWSRTRRRQLKGLCVACGYDLTGLGPNAKCPECGNAAPETS